MMKGKKIITKRIIHSRKMNNKIMQLKSRKEWIEMTQKKEKPMTFSNKKNPIKLGK